jgi:hypothetical protein
MFAPLVIALRQSIGSPQFNRMRGQAIGLHAQTITRFCQSVGIDNMKRQGLIRLARDNGKKLGLLA